MTLVSLYKFVLILNQRSPLTIHKPDRLNLNIKQRSPLTIHKPDRLNLNIKQRLHTKKLKVMFYLSRWSDSDIWGCSMA